MTVLSRTVSAPGWFPDPLGRHEHRYFNGESWTADVSDGGHRLIDPMGITSSAQPQPHTGNRSAAAAMTCGLIGAFLAWIPFLVVIGLILAILALIFGIKGLRKSRLVGSGRGFAITGLIAGVAALLLCVIGTIWSVQVVAEFVDFIEPGPLRVEVTSCEMSDTGIVIDGELTNLSDKTRTYTVYGWVQSPASGRGADMVVEVERVPAGTLVPFTLQRFRVGQAGSCRADLDVQGPRPYGIEIERIKD